MKFSIGIIFIGMLTLLSCGQKKNKINPKFDNDLYELIDKGFYKGKMDGKQYIKTIGKDDLNDSTSKMVDFYKEVPPIDIPSFYRLQQAGFYAKDKNHVYVWATESTGESITVLAGADPLSFTSFGYRWGKDSNAVYYEGKKIDGLDPEQIIPVCFEVIDSSLTYIDFIRDNDQLFYRGKKIKIPDSVDIETIYCKYDLFGNSLLAIDNNLYIIRNGAMEFFQ